MEVRPAGLAKPELCQFAVAGHLNHQARLAAHGGLIEQRGGMDERRQILGVDIRRVEFADLKIVFRGRARAQAL